MIPVDPFKGQTKNRRLSNEQEGFIQKMYKLNKQLFSHEQRCIVSESKKSMVRISLFWTQRPPKWKPMMEFFCYDQLTGSEWL